MDEAKKAVFSATNDMEEVIGYVKTAFLSLGGIPTAEQFKGIIESGSRPRSSRIN